MTQNINHKSIKMFQIVMVLFEKINKNENFAITGTISFTNQVKQIVKNFFVICNHSLKD